MCYQQFLKNMLPYDALIKKGNKVAIAVSGGADSVALLHLAHRWAQEFDLNLVALTVDHNLRQESKQEAIFVHELANSLKIDVYTLNWQHNGVISNIQEKARLARYALLTNKCLELDIKHLFTAHHMDDMIENYIIRQNKKAGVFGLLTSKRTFHNNIHILRPLYNVTKQELLDYLQKFGQEFCQDNSNFSTKYERVKIRQQLLSQENYPLLRQDIVEKQKTLAREAVTTRERIIKIIANHVQFNDMGNASLNAYSNIINEEHIYYVIAHIVTMVRGAPTPPRGTSIQNLLSQIQQWSQDTSLRNVFSLHGVRITCNDAQISFTREFGKNPPRDAVVSAEYTLWDDRFMVQSPLHIINQGYYVSYLTATEKKELSSKIDISTYKQIIFTIPIIKKLEKLVAIPHINYYDDENENDIYLVKFRPSFISNIVHFRS